MTAYLMWALFAVWACACALNLVGTYQSRRGLKAEQRAARAKVREAEAANKRRVFERHTQALEIQVAVPLAELVHQAEIDAEAEYRLALGLPRERPAFADCVWCSKEAICVVGEAEPVAWVLTEGCREHRSQS